jgi:hypothetical protein
MSLGLASIYRFPRTETIVHELCARARAQPGSPELNEFVLRGLGYDGEVPS